MGNVITVCLVLGHGCAMPFWNRITKSWSRFSQICHENENDLHFKTNLVSFTFFAINDVKNHFCRPIT